MQDGTSVPVTEIHSMRVVVKAKGMILFLSHWHTLSTLHYGYRNLFRILLVIHDASLEPDAPLADGAVNM